MLILGINAYHGDASAVLLRQGELVAAVEEERFSRIKHVSGVPKLAMRACLEMAGVQARDIDRFAISRNPRAHLWRKALYALRHRPGLRLITDRATNTVKVGGFAATLASVLDLPVPHVAPRLRFIEHHTAHLASSYCVSPFGSATVCAIDGFGDSVSTSWGTAEGADLRITGRVFFPHSLGMLYLAITQYLGFHHYGDEFKVMGLAPYGEPSFAGQIRQLVSVEPDGQLRLNLDYFTHWSGGAAMTWNGGAPTIGQAFSPKLASLLGPPRNPADPIEPRHEAIAASLQAVFEESVWTLLRAVHRRHPHRRLCLAGGCAMNSVANGKIREQTPFEEIYIQPAAGDNGTSLGAALAVWHAYGGARRFEMRHGYWGPSFDDAQIASALEARSADLARVASVARLEDDALFEATAKRIADGDIVGWFQGRMEWGARALGNRSILADPRRRDMRDIINMRIKFRERFRPFAPAIAEEALHDYFDGAVPDPFMLQVYPVRRDKRDRIPAVTHVDGSGRLQTVSRDANPRFWRLIEAFRSITGVPVLLNTSFNENEPIVMTPAEALDCFLRTDMDVLVMGNHRVEKHRG
jgi:carbamoyltransferase